MTRFPNLCPSEVPIIGVGGIRIQGEALATLISLKGNNRAPTKEIVPLLIVVFPDTLQVFCHLLAIRFL